MNKNRVIGSVAVGMALMLGGCNKFLDQTPVSTLAEANYYRNTAELKTAVIGCYSALLPLYNDNYIVVDLRSDDTYVSEAEGDHNQIDGFSERSTNSYLGKYWTESYFVIRQTNTVLKYLDNVTDSVSKRHFEGEAKFLRAHMYFNLVRLWGSVPLVTTSIAYNDSIAITQVPAAVTYEQIISDLKDAAGLLPVSWAANESSRVTTHVAKAMLAKVYLTRKDYASARPLLADLITSPGNFKLQPAYRNVFGIGNETNSEIMYSVRYRANSNGMGQEFTYNYARLTGSQNMRISRDLRNVFVTADSQRRNMTITQDGSYYLPGKFLDPGAPVKDAGADYIILRYADVILMYAEVLNETEGPSSDALAQLNKIRARAGVTQYTTTQLATQDVFRNAVKLERRLEFGTEGHRLFDLIRWGDLETAMNAAFVTLGRTARLQSYQNLYPIPQREIDITNGKLRQNSGY
jgi:hypothetical protein